MEEDSDNTASSESDICGELRTGSTGIDWICVRRIDPGHKEHYFITLERHLEEQP